MFDPLKGEVTPTDAGRLGETDDELRIYIAMRRDIGEHMSRAKFGVQVAHAALTTWLLCHKRDPERADRYMRVAQAKIVLQVKDDAELRMLHEKVRAAGFDAALITDAGRTEFGEPTLTCLGLGPIWFRAEGKEGKALVKRVRLYQPSAAADESGTRADEAP